MPLTPFTAETEKTQPGCQTMQSGPVVMAESQVFVYFLVSFRLLLTLGTLCFLEIVRVSLLEVCWFCYASDYTMTVVESTVNLCSVYCLFTYLPCLLFFPLLFLYLSSSLLPSENLAHYLNMETSQ